MSDRFIGKLGEAFSKLKKLFQRPTEQPVAKETVAVAPPEIISPTVEPQIPATTRPTHAPVVPSRAQRLWNIGLDFGTAYTKCIVRNLATEEAFLVPLHGTEYLLPTEVFCGSKFMWLHGDESKEENPTKVLHLKMALAEVSSGRMNGRWVEEFMRVVESSDEDGVPRHIEALTVYFLARVIQRARAFMLAQSPDFSEALGDRMMVNMAVPVAHAQDVGVSQNFQRCLKWAFLLSREPDLSRMSAEEIQSALAKIGEPPEQDIGCYLYPEVSANVQSYIKSPAGSPGLYLFIDVGAGTVDLSIFIFHPHEENDRPLSYPSAGVIPLGSSQIEMRAAQNLNGDRAETQERVRRAKEGHGHHDETIMQAIHVVEIELEDEMFYEAAPILAAPITIINGHRQIHPHQWASLKILIGGGGAGTSLYRNAVNRWFRQCNHHTPDVKPIPLPADLRWPPEIGEAGRVRLFGRFSVAYGLSFVIADLGGHRFPNEMPPLLIELDEPANLPHAPTQEEC